MMPIWAFGGTACLMTVLAMPGATPAGTDPPYPASPVIQSVTFADPSAIIRQARGSDNWPVTWGDDDRIYTAYGDGNGWGGSRVSLGTARVVGSPRSFSGENLSAIKDNKATGILMVDGVLYLWTRPSGSLWKSPDRGSRWTDTGIRMALPDGALGSLSFCQFGKNYANARDGYVYVYARNQQQNADDLVLFRTPKDKIARRSSYEFYAGRDGKGDPVWDADIGTRAPIFRDSGRANDQRVVYNPGIKRYLMTVNTYPNNGFLAIYDAPEPWGPWTTVYYTEKWGLGFTFEYNFPQKWISADGLTMHMVFSGTGANDAFCVREVTLKLRSLEGPGQKTEPPKP